MCALSIILLDSPEVDPLGHQALAARKRWCHHL